MVFRPEINPTLCFVLMPFGEPHDGYYQHVIKPAVQRAGLASLRGDEIYNINPVIQDIWNAIWHARVVIADVSGRNPNVNYELGLCHALGVPTILISKTVEDVPFDYRHRRFILYNTEFARWEERLAGALQKTIATILGETGVDAELPWPYHTQSPVEVEKMALREQRMSVAELMEGIDYHKAAQGLIPYCLALMQNVPEEEQEKLQRGIQLLTAAEMDEAIKVRILGLYLFNVVGLAVLTAAVDSLRVHLKRAASSPTRTSTPPPDPN